MMFLSQLRLIWLFTLAVTTTSLKLFASPMLCQFSLRRWFGSFSNATSLSSNATLCRLNDKNSFNHTQAYISVLQKRLNDAETDVMFCRMELITLRVNVTESQRELSQCKFQNTCYEQQLFDAEDRISYLEEAMYNMTVNGNATFISAITEDDTSTASGNSTEASISTETMEKLHQSGGATPDKNKGSKKLRPVKPIIPTAATATAAAKKASLLQRIFGRRKPSANKAAAATTTSAATTTPAMSLSSTSSSKKASVGAAAKVTHNATVVAAPVMSELEALEKHYQAKSDALMLTLTVQQRTIDELRREVESYAAHYRQQLQQQRTQWEEERQGELDRGKRDLGAKEERLAELQKQLELQHQELLLLQQQQQNSSNNSYGKSGSGNSAAASVAASSDVLPANEVSELLEDIAMKNVELMQLRKRIELLQTTSAEEAARHARDVEELQQRIQTMLDETENSTMTTSAISTANTTAVSAEGSTIGDSDVVMLRKENQQLRSEVSSANITIEFLQQQLAQLRLEHSKQHSNLKNVITQLEATTGYKPPAALSGEQPTAVASIAIDGVSSEKRQGSNIIVAVARCLGSLVGGIKRCVQRVLDYLHDL